MKIQFKIGNVIQRQRITGNRCPLRIVGIETGNSEKTFYMVKKACVGVLPLPEKFLTIPKNTVTSRKTELIDRCYTTVL